MSRQVYTTNEDNCVMEMPMMWGSNSTFDLQVYLRLGPLRLVVPMQVGLWRVGGWWEGEGRRGWGWGEFRWGAAGEEGAAGGWRCRVQGAPA